MSRTGGAASWWLPNGPGTLTAVRIIEAWRTAIDAVNAASGGTPPPPHDNTEMLTILTLLVAVIALLVSAAALSVAWFQLILQRNSTGGRGLIFDITQEKKRTLVAYRVLVKVIGNDRDEISLHLMHDSHPCDLDELGVTQPPPLRHRMTGSDEPLIWEFELDADAAKGIWCAVTWVEPYGDAIRTCAFRRRLGDKLQYEEWRWFRFMRERRLIETWVRNRRYWPIWPVLNGPVPREPWRLGSWRKYRMRPLRAGQTPLDSDPSRALFSEMQVRRM